MSYIPPTKIPTPTQPLTAPQINEPTITGQLHQLLEHMDLAESRVASLRGHLFGEGESGMQRSTPTTVRSMLVDLGTRLACLCGELATINSRMGCPPEPNPESNYVR